MSHHKLLTFFVFYFLLFTAQAQKKEERYTVLPSYTSLYLKMPDGQFEGMIYANTGAYKKEKGSISGKIEFNLDSINIHRIKDTSKIIGAREMLQKHPFFDTSISRNVICDLKTVGRTILLSLTINNITKDYQSTFGVVDLSDRQATIVHPVGVNFRDFYKNDSLNTAMLFLSIHITAIKDDK